MKKQILFLTLCIALLLSGCQKTPEALPAVQAEETPCEAESQDSQSSYNDLTRELVYREFGKSTARKTVRISGRPPKYTRSGWALPVRTSGRAG